MKEELKAKDLLKESANGEKSAHCVVLAPLSVLGEKAHKQWLKRHCLDGSETERLLRFRREQDQDRYLLAHSLKRQCLSYLLNKPALDCQFMTNDKGKPLCVDEGALDFNLSHSGDWVVLAISTKGVIGVDVEEARRTISDGVARYALTPEQLVKAGNDQQRLLTYWTQKEAISKALGQGLSIDFQTVVCDGAIGVSRAAHSGQQLRVESQWLGGDAILSVACAADVKPDYYLLSSWLQMDMCLQRFEN